jgi:hypothetical protein
MRREAMDMERSTFRLSSLWALLLGLSLALSGGAVSSQDEENAQIVTEAQLHPVIAVPCQVLLR